jgi:hypothetical protein
VLEEGAGEADTDAKSSPPSVIFHPASGIDEAVMALRRRLTCVGASCALARKKNLRYV